MEVEETTWMKSLEMYHDYYSNEIKNVPTKVQEEVEEEPDDLEDTIHEKMKGLGGFLVKKMVDEGVIQESDAQTIIGSLDEISKDIAANRKKKALFNLITDLGVPIAMYFINKKMEANKKEGGQP